MMFEPMAIHCLSAIVLQKPKERKAWYYVAADGTKQVAGFVKQYERLTFVTVRVSKTLNL